MPNINVTATGSASGAIAEIEALKAAISSVQGKTVHIKVEVDGGRAATDALGGIARARGSLGGLSRDTDRARQSSDRFRDSMRRANRDAEASRRSTGDLSASTARLGRESGTSRTNVRGLAREADGFRSMSSADLNRMSESLAKFGEGAQTASRHALAATNGVGGLVRSQEGFRAFSPAEVDRMGRSVAKLGAEANKASAKRPAIGGAGMRSTISDMQELESSASRVGRASEQSARRANDAWRSAPAGNMMAGGEGISYTGPQPRTGGPGTYGTPRTRGAASLLEEERAAKGAASAMDEVEKSTSKAGHSSAGTGISMHKLQRSMWDAWPAAFAVSALAGTMHSAVDKSMEMSTATASLGMNLDGFNKVVARTQNQTARGLGIGPLVSDQERLTKEAARADTRAAMSAIQDSVRAQGAMKRAQMGAQAELTPEISGFAQALQRNAPQLQSIMRSLGSSALQLGGDAVEGFSRSAPAWQQLASTITGHSASMTNAVEQMATGGAKAAAGAVNTVSALQNYGDRFNTGWDETLGTTRNQSGTISGMFQYGKAGQANRAADRAKTAEFAGTDGTIGGQTDKPGSTGASQIGYGRSSGTATAAQRHQAAIDRANDPNVVSVGGVTKPGMSLGEVAGPPAPAPTPGSPAAPTDPASGLPLRLPRRVGSSAGVQTSLQGLLSDVQAATPQVQAAGANLSGALNSGLQSRPITPPAGVRQLPQQVQAQQPAVQSAGGGLGGALNLGLQSRPMQAVAAAVTAPARTMVRAVESVAPAMASAGAGLGAAAVGGMGQSITKTQTNTLTIVKKWITKVIEAGAAALDAHSPSREFVTLGQSIPDGLAVGMGRAAPGAFAATQRMTDQVISNARSQMGAQAAQVGGILPQAITSVASGMTPRPAATPTAPTASPDGRQGTGDVIGDKIGQVVRPLGRRLRSVATVLDPPDLRSATDGLSSIAQSGEDRWATQRALLERMGYSAATQDRVMARFQARQAKVDATAEHHGAAHDSARYRARYGADETSGTPHGQQKDAEAWRTNAGPRDVRAAYDRAAQGGREVGGALPQGMNDGMKKEQPSLWRQAGEMTTNLVNKTKKWLGIESPSTVFADIGANVTAGMSGGIASASDSVRGVADDSGLRLGYIWGRSVVTGADAVIQRDLFQGLSVPTLESPQAKAALAAQGLLGPAGSGASIWKTPMVSFGTAGSSPAPVVLNAHFRIDLDGQPFREMTVTQIDQVMGTLASAIITN